ncbi:MAG TPA: hypothetical protein VK737_04700 [Opitutales bacterium]|jgi:hypothetical protein|nr:hypothetical protein [Opitutales bacterium]
MVVGGYAVMKYTEPRYTKDLDLWIAVDSANAKAVFDSLRKFGAPLEKLQVHDFQEQNQVYQMGRPPLRVDILMSVDGVDFEAAWPRREEMKIAGMKIPFISQQDLIKNKRATGRPQDKIDLENLEALPLHLKPRRSKSPSPKRK